MGKQPGFLQKCAKVLLQCFWPQDPTDAIYEKATAAYQKYQSSNNPQDLKFALDNFEAVLAARRAADGEHPQLAVTLTNYAAALWAHYETTGRPEADLRRVISFNKEARDIWCKITPRPKGYPILLTNLGNAYFEAYCRDRNPDVFQKAIAAYEAVQDDETSNAQIRNTALARLGITLWTRCDLEKMNRRLDEGIDNLEKALWVASNPPTNDNILRALCLASLANAYDVRFQRFKQAEDLEHAIQYGDDARSSPQASPSEHQASLYNLSRLLWARYQRMQNRDDLDGAETVAKEAQGMVGNGELKTKIDGILKAMEVEKINLAS